MGYEIPAGSFTSTLPKLAEATSLTVKQIRTALDKLNHTNHINSTGRAVKIKDGKMAKPRQFTVFQVVGWEKFQDERADQGQTKGRPGADQGQTKGRHNKNEKNEENEEKLVDEPKKIEGEDFKVLNDIIATSDQENHIILNAIALAPDEPAQITTDDLQHTNAIKAMLYPYMGLENGYKPSKGQIIEAMALIYQQADEFYKSRWSVKTVRNNFASILGGAKHNHKHKTQHNDRLEEIRRKAASGQY